MDIKVLFTDLLTRIGFSGPEAATHWSDLEKVYSHKSRHYHNLNHLQEMIVCWEQEKPHLHFPDEVLYAIFYHDYIYKSTKKNNELKSAERAVVLLPSVTIVNSERIFNLILSTKDHQCSSNEDEKWLIDFDLKILSKEWEDYILYAQQIRKEYRIYPDFMYNPGRKKALQHFLENKYIYQTDTFRNLYEAKARENVNREIAFLSHPNFKI